MRNSVRNGVLPAVVAALITIATMVVLRPPDVTASQNTLGLPTTGVFNGLAEQNSINNALDALLTCNSGTTAPTNALGGAPKEGQCWLDTTSSTMKIKKRYTGSAWVVESVLDVTNGINVLPVGGGTGSVTAASTTDLCASPQAVQTVSGNTTIAGFGSSCVPGIRKTLIFTGTPTLTYNATSMILPGTLDYTVAAGDVVEAIPLGSGNWRVANITRVNGNAVINPSVEVGTMHYFIGGSAPTKYVFGFGQAITRTSFPDYLTAVTRAQNGTRTSGNNTLTSVSDTSSMGAGMPIEGTGIPAATTISSVTSSTIVMSANASSSGTSTATVFFTGYGASGSSTTVGVPDCRGRVVAGRDDMGGTAASRLTTAGFGTGSTALNASGSSLETVTMAAGNLIQHLHAVFLNDPGHAHSYTGGAGSTSVTAGGGTQGIAGAGQVTSSVGTGITVRDTTGGGGTANQTANTGSASPTPMRTVQPTLIAQCIVRVLTMNDWPFDDLPVNDNIAAIERRRLA